MSKDYLVIVALFLTISAVTAVDVINDFLGGGSVSHISVEIVIFMISIAGILWLLRQFHLIRNKKRELAHDLEKVKKELSVWKADAEKYLKGLGDAIDRQMNRWNLTPAEKEIGLLMLKGFSFKEIATFRGTSERTVRQQSLDIYRKSGLSGRAEFSAFFLEDLLLPLEPDNDAASPTD